MNFLGKILKCSSAFGIRFDSMKKKLLVQFFQIHIYYIQNMALLYHLMVIELYLLDLKTQLT